MPSVRVRRSTYSGDTQDRSLAAIFAEHSPPPPPGPPIPFPSNTLRGSRIQSHITATSNVPIRVASVGRSSVTSGALSPDSLARPATPLSHHSGTNTDVVVRARSDGQPGLIGSALSLPSSQGQDTADELDHHDDVVDHLDVIDPQVATVQTLTNAANAILFPPTWYSIKPVVTLSSPPQGFESADRPGKEYEDSLDRHVEDLLKRPSKIRRTLKGVWAFVKTRWVLFIALFPHFLITTFSTRRMSYCSLIDSLSRNLVQVLTAIYGFAVVFWGAAIVIFLAKIINLHNENTQGFWVEVSSQVENGLFTVTGIGLIPARVLDTYRIYWIWYYKRRTRRLRAKAGLPTLFDEDDLPDPAYDQNYVHVLTDKEQQFLHRQQVKFARHQTWYMAHGTETHRAFPINTALLICCLNDGNSIFQIMLCGTMWGLNRFQRPAWSTGILIPASFLCGIFAAVFIAIGGAHTKRVEKVKERLRAALAMEHPAIDGVIPGLDHVKTEEEKRPNGRLPDDDELAAETATDERMVIPRANDTGTV
ncbi:hypothetical protein MIND_00742300 [Mycena indigotica]|uniref:Uncharacterized protein n=1 Tax=Mycena indigotica TaxID=2126181 RepID=A0A8H6SP12_9AGAR|nr:uncharacterized protein MIND_00742300 [Mycena indigotica]KAF7301767.1 hypothetical protein MIND_00742300 [Mycena indigotica]